MVKLVEELKYEWVWLYDCLVGSLFCLVLFGDLWFVEVVIFEDKSFWFVFLGDINDLMEKVFVWEDRFLFVCDLVWCMIV